MATKVLVVDDDEHVREVVKLYLENEGFQVLQAADGEEGLRKLEEAVPDLLVLDIMLPKVEGWEVCRQVRRTGQMPIIMLTAKGEEFDKVLGLELGADDYLTKPFSPRELTARVKAILRRQSFLQTSPPAERVIRQGNLVINLDYHQVQVDDIQVELAPRELELLWFLARNAGRAFSRDQILEQVWGYEYFGDTRTVDVHIKRLRQKLEVPGNPYRYLKTVWGVGYKFEATLEPERQEKVGDHLTS